LGGPLGSDIMKKNSTTKPLAFIGTRFGNDGLFQAAEELGITIAGWFDRYYAGNTEMYSGYPILGSDLEITKEDKENYNFFLGSHYSGHPVTDNPEHNGLSLRLDRIRIIREHSLPLINLITPSAYIHPTTKIGQGIYVGHNAIIRANCVLGDFTYFCHGSGLGDNVEVKENSIILAHAVTSGDVLIEENCMIGINATVVNGYYNEKLTIGKNSKVAAGAVVYKNVEPNKFVSVQGKIMQRLDKE
jgi:carbonic anhydrase/acetyltransferase-like protein (isoleucine patch superfamily)